MATLTTDFRALWLGTHASIPASWSRDTAYDELFLGGAPDGDPADSAQTGGSATHRHLMPVHSHSGDSHQHSVTGASTTASSTTHTTGGSASQWSLPEHGHSGGFTNAETINYQDSTVLTYTGYVSPNQLYVKAIIIEPDDGNQQLPDDAVGLWDNARLPIGYEICDGDNGTPADTDDTFILGADNPDGDGGATGGTSQHQHSLGHTHETDSHIHDTWVSGGNSTNTVIANPSLTGFPKSGIVSAHESIQTDAFAGYTSATTSESSTNLTFLPAYRRLMAIQNQTGGDSLVPDIILMFKGTVANIPSGWVLCDGTLGTQDTGNVQIYITTDPAEIGDGGGSNTHRHSTTAIAHTHDADTAHQHATVYELTARVKRSATLPVETIGRDAIGDLHTHTWTNVAVAATTQVTSPGNSEYIDSREPYIDILFIKYVPERVHIQGANILGAHIAGN